jgi:hypothetical protein
MKKIAEFCPACNKETTHREKRVCFKKSKREGYGTIVLPLKCLACNYLHGGRIKPKVKLQKFIKI